MMFFKKLRKLKLTQAPYNPKKIAENIMKNANKSNKNRCLNAEEFAPIAGVSPNTVRSWPLDAYKELDKYLELPYSVDADHKEQAPKTVIRISGCKYGRFGVVAWPILPRIVGRLRDCYERTSRHRKEVRTNRKMIRRARQKRTFGLSLAIR